MNNWALLFHIPSLSCFIFYLDLWGSNHPSLGRAGAVLFLEFRKAMAYNFDHSPIKQSNSARKLSTISPKYHSMAIIRAQRLVIMKTKRTRFLMLSGDWLQKTTCVLSEPTILFVITKIVFLCQTKWRIIHTVRRER